MGKEFSVSAKDSIDFQSGFSASKVSGHTGREVECFEHPPQVRAWAALEAQDELLTHALANPFRVALDSASCLSGEFLTVYRGQPIAELDSIPSIRGYPGMNSIRPEDLRHIESDFSER